MISWIKSHLRELIEKEVLKSQWKSKGLFYKIKRLSIDQRGRIGEHFLKNIFEKLKYKVKYLNNAHGDWDIIVKKIKIEVKLATLDVNNKFQHEGIKASKKWDIVAFVDIAPNDLYVTFIPKNKFTFNDKKGIFDLYGEERTAHFRGKDNSNERATGSGYKVDLPVKKLKKIDTLKDLKNLFDEAMLSILKKYKNTK